MSEIYSSASGSYSSYLSQRQTDEIKQQVQKSANQQMFATAMTGYYLGTKIDSVNQNIVRMSTGIQNSINQNTYTIAASAEMLKETFDAGFDAINNKLDMGFAGVTNAIGAMSASMTAGFNAVSAAIDYWGEKICEKLDAIHDIVNNPLLTASRELYRRAAKNSEKKFYEEALEDIKSAIEKNKTDYISWGLMGKLYLFGISEFSNVVDVPLALDAFKNACKYISPDIDESEEAKKMAAEFYFYLGYANYILSNESRLENKTDDVINYLQESVKANERSFSLSDTMLEAAYNQARSLTLLDKKEEALSILEDVIRTDGLYSIRALSDADLKTVEGDVVLLIRNLRDEYKPVLKDVINEFSENYECTCGNYSDYIKQLINKGNELISSDCQYLDIRTVFERFTYEFSKIKKSEEPVDIVVYENKYDDHNQFVSPLKIEHFCENPFYKISAEYCAKGFYQWYPRKNIHKSQVIISKDSHSEYGYISLKLIQSSYGTKGNVVISSYKDEVEKIKNEEKFVNENDFPLLDTGYLTGNPGEFDFEDASLSTLLSHQRIFHEYCDDCDWWLNENTVLRIDIKNTRLVVLQRGIVSKDFLRKTEQEKKKEEEEAAQKKEKQKIEAQQRARERAYEAKVAKKYRVIYILGIIMIVPLVILGRFLLQKSGMFIFGFFDIAFISYYVAKSNFGGIGGSDYSPQKFLFGWGLYQKKNAVLHISMTLALSILGAKLGSFIHHGFLGFLAGFVVYILLVIILCSKSQKRYGC